MKARLFLPLAVSVLFALCAVSSNAATTITFDDLSETAQGSLITNAYQGLVWSNFYANNAILFTNIHLGLGVDGVLYGMVSASNVAVNALGNPAEIDSSTSFNFLSAYLTGVWKSNLNIEVEGFRGPRKLYDTTVVASATNSTLFAFNYLNIDRLYFNSSGGLSAGFPMGGGENFAMDNFTFEFVPEPSTFLLTGAGVLTLCALRRRKRT